MSFGLSRFGSVALIWVLSSWVVSLAHGQGQAQPQRSIELTETNNAEILTNLNSLTTLKEAAKPLEEQLRALKGFSSGSSMEDSFSMPYVAPTLMPNSKRIRELLNRQKNWALSPDQINPLTGSYDSDTLSLFGEDKKSSQKSLQEFYNALSQPSGKDQSDQPGVNNPSKPSAGFDRSQDSFDSGAFDDDSTLPAGIRDKTQKLKAIVSQDSGSVFNPTRAPSSFDNFFGLTGMQEATPDPTTLSKPQNDSFLDEYKKGLDPTAVLGLNPALNVLLPKGASLRTAILPELNNPVVTAQPKPFESTAANVGTVVDPTAFSDLNQTVLNQWNPLYSAPKMELPKVNSTPTIPLNFEYPRRRF